MIRITRLDGSGLHVNADLVAQVEEHHDTVLTLTDGRVLVCAETAAEVVARVVAYRAQVLAEAERLLEAPTAAEPPRLVVVPPPDAPGSAGGEG